MQDRKVYGKAVQRPTTATAGSKLVPKIEHAMPISTNKLAVLPMASFLRGIANDYALQTPEGNEKPKPRFCPTQLDHLLNRKRVQESAPTSSEPLFKKLLKKESTKPLQSKNTSILTSDVKGRVPIICCPVKYCFNIYVSKEAFISHLNSHKGIEICAHCWNVFNNEVSLIEHQRFHEVPY